MHVLIRIKKQSFLFIKCLFPVMLFGLTAFCLLGPAQCWSQDDTRVHIVPRETSPPANARPESADDHPKPFRTETNLVLVPATVTDSMDRLVTGLDKQNFEVYQDHTKEHLQALWSQDAPISVGVIFDVSGSMTDKILKAREAIRTFLETANPEDEFFLIAFSDRPHLVSGFSRKIDNLEGRLMFAQPHGTTALLDAVYLGLSTMKNARYQRRALLIISDGGDNHSRYTENEVKSVVEEADVQIFSIGIFDMFASTPEERYGPQLLSDITAVTGGQSFTVSDPKDLPDVANKIGIALRNEYILAYEPTVKPHDGKWHKIRVKLHPPKGLPPLHVSAKQGFYAASE
jgi:Ca-activated chloride channel family protein